MEKLNIQFKVIHAKDISTYIKYVKNKYHIKNITQLYNKNEINH